jgi:hypothetical protein
VAHVQSGDMQRSHDRIQGASVWSARVGLLVDPNGFILMEPLYKVFGQL